MGPRCGAYNETGNHLKILSSCSGRAGKPPIHAFLSVVGREPSATPTARWVGPIYAFLSVVGTILSIRTRLCTCGETNAFLFQLEATTPNSAPASIRLLVASSQAISLIGKQGTMIKYIQESTNATIRVLFGDEVPHHATTEEGIIGIAATSNPTNI
ncbi:hypothetical protein IEQ34_004537 [Dendrobium chrysotoxum]|uniref:K Homology domain-containing protein n=1 Tax=Dendrobium chrysotoxum TaxID=161865 RepID=A0AAV7HHI3_DENCH|nr:hypothetical protein IEQ34_004537 [Dendrobium chrysotoxum]